MAYPVCFTTKRLTLSFMSTVLCCVISRVRFSVHTHAKPLPSANANKSYVFLMDRGQSRPLRLSRELGIARGLYASWSCVLTITRLYAPGPVGSLRQCAVACVFNDSGPTPAVNWERKYIIGPGQQESLPAFSNVVYGMPTKLLTPLVYTYPSMGEWKIMLLAFCVLSCSVVRYLGCFFFFFLVWYGLVNPVRKSANPSSWP